jgi:hypothetical protein
MDIPRADVLPIGQSSLSLVLSLALSLMNYLHSTRASSWHLRLSLNMLSISYLIPSYPCQLYLACTCKVSIWGITNYANASSSSS